MWDYTDKVKDHFFNPRNVGKIKNPDGVGEVGSMACGDALTLMFKLDKDGRIYEAKFQTFGCASAIASSSALTEIIKGKTLEEAAKITNQDIADYLGDLPEQKMHCSVMGKEALDAAIENYKTGEKQNKILEGKVTCVCFGVSEQTIEEVIRANNLKTVESVTHYTKAGGGCGRCHPEIEEILDRINGKTKPVEAPIKDKRPKLTNLRRIQLIQETIEKQIRPQLMRDGGDIEIIDIDGPKVIVAMRGTCSSCQMSKVTLRDVVEVKLREFVSDDIVVAEESK